VIAVSFVEGLPNRDEPGHDIINHLGPNLSQVFTEVRPSG
jgi:hypothetical protein